MQKFLLPLVLLLMTPFVQAAIKFTIKDEPGEHELAVRSKLEQRDSDHPADHYRHLAVSH